MREHVDLGVGYGAVHLGRGGAPAAVFGAEDHQRWLAEFDEPIGEGTLLYAPARAPHRVIAPEGRILLLFTDCASGSGAGLRAVGNMERQVGTYGVEHRRECELIAACRLGPSPDMLRRLVEPRVPGAADWRVRRVVEEIRDDPGRVFRADESARRLGLSTPHFLRLFAQHTGTTFRRYQQWTRLLRAARGIAAGHAFTRCAADAGFASPSHLSDTFRRTLGTSATAVLDSHVRFELDF